MITRRDFLVLACATASGAMPGVLHATRAGPAGKGLMRWAVDVDPLLI